MPTCGSRTMKRLRCRRYAIEELNDGERSDEVMLESLSEQSSTIDILIVVAAAREISPFMYKYRETLQLCNRTNTTNNPNTTNTKYIPW